MAWAGLAPILLLWVTREWRASQGVGRKSRRPSSPSPNLPPLPRGAMEAGCQPCLPRLCRNIIFHCTARSPLPPLFPIFCVFSLGQAARAPPPPAAWRGAAVSRPPRTHPRLLGARGEVVKHPPVDPSPPKPRPSGWAPQAGRWGAGCRGGRAPLSSLPAAAGWSPGSLCGSGGVGGAAPPKSLCLSLGEDGRLSGGGHWWGDV